MQNPAAELIHKLRGPSLRCRTGIVLLAPDDLGYEAGLAVRLGVDAEDYVKVLLENLAPDARFVGIGDEEEEQRLHRIAQANGGPVVLVYNFDVALTRMKWQQRERLWRHLFAHFPHRRRALLLAVPEKAHELLPAGTDRRMWEKDGRIVPASERAIAF